MLGIWSNDPRVKLGGGVLLNFKSTPYSDIALPKLVTDPLYTSSQASLDKLGTGLINGDVPDYYKSIGDFNSPQFQAMLNSVKGQVMQSSQEASAINGTGRSGVAVTASNNALNSVVPQLTYQDYLRAIQGRGALLDTGVNVEQGVRQSAQNQQQFDTNFNQTLFGDKAGLANLMDSWKKDAAGAEGAFYGNIGTALFGQNVGNLISGGMNSANGASPGISSSGSFSGLSSLFSSLGNMNLGGPSGVNGASGGTTVGLADQLGSFSPGSLSSFGGGSISPVDLAALAA